MPAKRDRKRNDQVRLKNPLEKRIKDYSLAALGIGGIAFAPAASAAIVKLTVTPIVNLGVFTPIVIGGNNVVSLYNSSSDGVRDVSARGVAGGGLVFGVPGPMAPHPRALSPIPSNQVIPGGTLAQFSHNGQHPNLVSSNTHYVFTGFLNGNSYLGFSFQIGGQPHYGWVELAISQPGGPGHHYVVSVVNAAYEDVAGKSITAGQLLEPAAPNATPAPNSLWLLALGAAGLGGLELLRRRRTA